MVKRYQNDLEPGLPSSIKSWFLRMLNGMASIISDGYGDQNKKRGFAWEASRELNAVGGTSYYSVIKLGSLPIDLKARTLGGSGDGLTGRMYRLKAGELNLTGLTPDKVFNKHRSLTTQPEFELYALPNATRILNGATPLETFLSSRECAAPIHIRVNSQTQGRGFNPAKHNSDGILDPEFEDLFLFELKAHSNQWITAYLDIYEGELDYRLKPE
jgi:hypothetical protein